MWMLFWLVVVALILFAIAVNLRDLVRYFKIRRM